MNIQGAYGNQLAQTAVSAFFQGGNVANRATQLTQSSAMNSLQQMANSFMQGLGQAMGQQMMGMSGMQAPGFLNPPMGNMAPMAQQMNSMQNMMPAWNSMGNMMNSGQLGGQTMQQMGQLGGMMQQMVGMMTNLANMMNSVSQQIGMHGQVNQATQAAQLNAPFAQNPMGALPGATPNATAAPNQAPNANAGFKFPGVAGSDFLSKLPKDAGGVAKMLNVSGSSDVKKINNAVAKLKTAKAEINPPGGAASKTNLDLTPAQVEAIRKAPDAASAKKLALEILGKKAGVDVSDLNINDKNGIRNDKYRNAVNKLIGKNIRSGREKNSGSALILDSMAESLVKGVKGGSFGSQTVTSPGGIAFMGYGGMGGMQQQGAQNVNNMGGFAQSAGGYGQTPIAQNPMGEMSHNWCGTGAAQSMGMAQMFGGMGMWLVPGQTQTIANPPTGVSVELSGFAGAADEVAKLASPLIFDLEGTGLQLSDDVRMIAVDIDGDGGKELITDIDAELGLLIFDSTGEGITELTGADMFGDNTDLSKYGINAPSEDGKFKDGFQALRALCEHFRLVDAGKQHLDASDLAVLQDKVGLRMRVGGIDNGEQRTFEELGVSQINLGNPAQTQHIEDAPEDKWGNKIMFQDGATFTIYGEVRQYADIWFKIQARLGDSPEEELSLPKNQLLSLQTRR